MKIDGGCYCGKITFTSEIDPDAISICHCTSCQMLSGGTYRVSVRADADKTHITGEPKSFIKVADSGNRRRQGFCGNCGSPLFSCDEVNPQTYMLRVGTITQRAQFHPNGQIWARSKLPWLDEIAGTPAVATDK
ncbi:MAG: GFA family protein [Pseudolabrys sp.]